MRSCPSPADVAVRGRKRISKYRAHTELLSCMQTSSPYTTSFISFINSVGVIREKWHTNVASISCIIMLCTIQVEARKPALSSGS